MEKDESSDDEFQRVPAGSDEDEMLRGPSPNRTNLKHNRRSSSAMSMSARQMTNTLSRKSLHSVKSSHISVRDYSEVKVR